MHALNIHGVFFERRCTAAVAAVPEWSVVSTNYPVEYPPPNGPWRGKESNLDIRARKVCAEGHVFDLQIECKKANPEFVNWVFFSKPDAANPAPFRITASINSSAEAGVDSWNTSLIVQDGTTVMVVASDAREVRGDYLKAQGGSKTKTSNAAIQDAAYQAAIANRSIVQEDSELLRRARGSAQHTTPPWNRKIYLPIIVTTARLFQTKFLPEDVDLASGEIQLASVSLHPVDSLAYEYPLPKHLQHTPQDPLPALLGSEMESFTRMHIIVIQSDALVNLLASLK